MSDDLIAEIDRIATANGQTRSAWIVQTLSREAVHSSHDNVPLIGLRGSGDPDDVVRVTVRLSRREIEAIDTVGSPMGLIRNEWIKRTLRWKLWDKAGVLRLCPSSQTELGKLRKQVVLIGKNINQAVHAMNAANMPGSSLDIARIAAPFLETCADLKAVLFATRRAASSYVGAEVGYWTDGEHEVVR